MWLRHLPHDGAYAREIDVEGSEWGLSEQLLAAIADRIEWGNHQRAGAKGAAPKPIPRPGVTSGRAYGKTDLPPDEAKALLLRYREGHYDTEGGDDGD